MLSIPISTLKSITISTHSWIEGWLSIQNSRENLEGQFKYTTELELAYWKL